jgi:tellurite resistance protein TerC
VGGTPLWAWAGTIAAVAGLLGLDFLIAARRPHVVGLAEAAWWSAFYIAVALLFTPVLWLTTDADTATSYLTGWLVEKSLSVDNLFVFVIIMTRFLVPPEYQQKILLFGISLALVLRAVLIAIGAAAVRLFSPTFLVFGLALIWTAVQLVRHRNDDPDPEQNPMLRAAKRVLPATTDFRNGRLFARVDGRLSVTPLFMVFVTIGSTDLLFALDSIPAVFGLTKDPFIVFCANAFALLGLRALYFLIQGLLERLIYLAVGLALILGFIGVKLILEFLHDRVWPAAPTVTIPVSLAAICAILVVTTLASLIRGRKRPRQRAHAGRLGAPSRHGETQAAPGVGYRQRREHE